MAKGKRRRKTDRIARAKIAPEEVEKALKRRYRNVYRRYSTVVIVSRKGRFTVPVRPSPDPMFGVPSYRLWQHVLVRRLRSGKTDRIKILLSVMHATSASDLAKQVAETISKYAYRKGQVENFSRGRAEVIDLLNSGGGK